MYLSCISSTLVSEIEYDGLRTNSFPYLYTISGADPGFQVRGGAQLKKLRRAEGGAKIFGVFRVKNHDFTPKKSYFFQF